MVSVNLKRLKALPFVDHSLSGFSAIISDYDDQQHRHDHARMMSYLQYDNATKAMRHEDERYMVKILHTSVGLDPEGTRAKDLRLDGG